MPAPRPASLGQSLLELEGGSVHSRMGWGSPIPSPQATLWPSRHQWATLPSASANVQPIGSPSSKWEGTEEGLGFTRLAPRCHPGQAASARSRSCWVILSLFPPFLSPNAPFLTSSGPELETAASPLPPLAWALHLPPAFLSSAFTLVSSPFNLLSSGYPT